MNDLALKVLEWQSGGHVGVSSATMASIAMGMDKNFYHHCFDAPYDPSDFTRCMNLVEQIPEIRDHFPAIAKRVPEFSPILDNFDELAEMVKAEWDAGDRAPKTYARMKELMGRA